MKIAVHTIVPVQPGNANRDDVGQCKTVTFGGVTRVRYSPQSRTSAIRPLLAEAVANGRGRSTRTRLLKELVSDAIKKIDPGMADADKKVRLDALTVLLASKERTKAEQDAEAATTKWDEAKAALDAARAAGGSSEETLEKLTKDESRAKATMDTKVAGAEKEGALWLVSDAQTEALAKVLITATADEMEKSKAASKDKGKSKKADPLLTKMVSALSSTPSFDEAAFGRMFAALRESSSIDIDGAVQRTHTFGVGEFTPDVDFFTAIDAVEKKARMMDYTYLSAPIMYAHSAVDVDLLARNLDMDPEGEEFASGLRILVRLLATVMPTGRETTSGSVSEPTAVYITAGPRAGTLASAFLVPTDSDIEATHRLLRRSAKFSTGLGLGHAAEALWTVHDEELDPAYAELLRPTLDSVVAEAVTTALGG